MRVDWVNLLKQFGFPVVVCCALGWFIVFLMGEHKEERRIWSDIHDKQVDRMIAATESHKEATNNLEKALISLEATIKNRTE